MSNPRFKVLMVCMGNICRSPTAHAVFRDKLVATGWDDRIAVDSAGTHAYHLGSPPDERSQEHAEARGYDLSSLRAKHLTTRGIEQADLVLAMDWENLALIQAMTPDGHEAKVKRLTEFAVKLQSPVVPDPYYGAARGFEEVLDIVEDACDGLLAHLQERIQQRTERH
jgi:protein-tyrosine phosphatase